MKNLARWLKFLLLVAVLFAPFGCQGVIWTSVDGRDRDGRWVGDEQRDRDGRRDTGDNPRADAEQTQDHAKRPG